MAGLLNSAKDLQPTVRTRRIGRRVHWVPECSSTNDLALKHAPCNGDGNADGDVFFADFQTAGRGRLGRKWAAPRGASLLCSIRLIEPFDPPRWARLSLASAIAVHEAVRDATGLTTKLKWPNDVLIRDRKVAGILIETRADHPDGHVVAVGIGINCLQHAAHFGPDLSARATSLDMESTEPIDRHRLARSLVASLDHWLAPDRLDETSVLRDAWCRLSRTIGSRIRLRSDGREYAGHVLDLDPNAGILVSLDVGAQKLFCPLTTSTID